MNITVWKINPLYGYGETLEEKYFSSPEAAAKFLSEKVIYGEFPNPQYLRSYPDGFKNLKRESSFMDYPDDSNGFFRITAGPTVTKTEIKDKDVIVTFSREVFVQFFNARIDCTPEIKQIGKLYQPAKKELVILEESQKYPLFVCRGEYDFETSQYFRGQPVISRASLYASKTEIEIID